jgi:hypothetical protein
VEVVFSMRGDSCSSSTCPTELRAEPREFTVDGVIAESCAGADELTEGDCIASGGATVLRVVSERDSCLLRSPGRAGRSSVFAGTLLGAIVSGVVGEDASAADRDGSAELLTSAGRGGSSSRSVGTGVKVVDGVVIGAKVFFEESATLVCLPESLARRG